MEKENTWKRYKQKDVKAAFAFAEDYKAFISHAKTERECVDAIVNDISAAGYVELDELIKNKTALKPGDKVYAVHMNKTLVMFQIEIGRAHV